MRLYLVITEDRHVDVEVEVFEDKEDAVFYAQAMGANPNELVDHKNHNTLDNRRTNLRVCTKADNVHNQRSQQGCSSKYKGVYWHKGNSLWMAYIHKGKTNIPLGYFGDEVEAARSYDVAAREYFGEFACLNFPE